MANLRLGLKLFSNMFEQYKEEAIEIIKSGYADYIELFVYPDSFDVLKDWESLKIEHGINFTIHSPHSSQNVNLVVPELLDYNKKVYAQMDVFMDALDAEYMIVHSGRKGSIKETVRQLNIIQPKRMMIENTPYFSPKFPDIVAAGGTVEEIKYVLDNHDCGFCFDVGHAFCSAVAINREPYEYMGEFLKLDPNCYHLSDGEIKNKIDKHFHISKGDYDWKRIMETINKERNMTLETITKNYSKTLLTDFVEDTKILRGLC
ncbi:MAG: sugar phosphate isomerase/epimerase [Candidatus Gastranaerophilales bacterium]|nr:sugar phosphate isomerase/epimerase [Candidatus Gastranaerophilales bacterium]